MSRKSTLTRRAALASIAAGTVLTLGSSHGFTVSDALRDSTLETTEDPNAYLGLNGHEAPSDGFTVTNNSNTYDMSVTVATTNFIIENDGDGGSDREWTFSLPPNGSQPLTFFQQDGNQDDVEFDARLLDSGGATVGSVELTRTLSIPAESGKTYRIRNFNSGKYLTLENGNLPRNVFQDSWNSNSNNPRQKWQIVDNGDGTVRLETQWNAASDVLTAFPYASVNGLYWLDWDAQRWYLDIDSQGRYTIRSADDLYDVTHVADVEDDSEVDGADVIIYEREQIDDSTPENQRWIFEEV